jgi:hypothetical protein
MGINSAFVILLSLSSFVVLIYLIKWIFFKKKELTEEKEKVKVKFNTLGVSFTSEIGKETKNVSVKYSDVSKLTNLQQKAVFLYLDHYLKTGVKSEFIDEFILWSDKFTKKEKSKLLKTEINKDKIIRGVNNFLQNKF